MIPIIAFGISCGLLALFLGFKDWEERKGRHLASGMRTRLDQRAEMLVSYVRHEIPILLAFIMKIATVLALTGLSHSLKHIGEVVRTGFRQFIHVIDGKIELKKRGSASFYLREITEHKRSLATGAGESPTRTV